MGRPYSMDLRERVVAALGYSMSCRRAAELFSVSASTANNWAKRVRESGSVATGKQADTSRGRFLAAASRPANPRGPRRHDRFPRGCYR